MEEGVRILELAGRASELFERQPAEEKRRLPKCVLSNSSWKEGKLTAQFRQPFDMLVVAKENVEAAAVAQDPEKGGFEIWLPQLRHCRETYLVDPSICLLSDSKETTSADDHPSPYAAERRKI